MQNILAPTQHPLLQTLAKSNVLLAFDYDGTLAPIVDDAGHAYMSAATRELLWQVTQRYPVIVITGRAQLDALHRMRGVGVLEVIGNHGIEPRHASNRYAELVRNWRPKLEACSTKQRGVWIEDKIYTLAVHYRAADDRAAAHAAILEAAAQLDDARIVAGNMVVNVIPRGAADKGRALVRELEHLHCSRAIYVGDDETDEDVFALAEADRLLGIRVGARGTSAATHFVPDQASIDELLRLLIDLRKESDQGPGQRWVRPSD